MNAKVALGKGKEDGNPELCSGPDSPWKCQAKALPFHPLLLLAAVAKAVPFQLTNRRDGSLISLGFSSHV